ncbi:MAG: glutamate-5-semialdehyde dehydrogenase [Candidatus Aureabacteria bacterium]|nr:glutamate-5-semialdehyde dehydrogenase [Candidatus Auribacterota bacterium]
MRSSEKIKEYVKQLAGQAKDSSRKLALMSADQKNGLLKKIAVSIRKNKGIILEANTKDVKAAEKDSLSKALIDRLLLDERRIEQMAAGLEEVAALDDPVGRMLDKRTRPNGMQIFKISVPIGVIAIIYESRPNVTSDSAGLCIKAGNAVILRGGKEAFYSNKSIADCMRNAIAGCGGPENIIQFVETKERSAVAEILKLDSLIDLVIPRGGESLIKAVTEMSTIPVIKHYKGVCHIFVDKDADLDKALKIIKNAKCQRPGVCNAAETLLVDKAVSEKFLPQAADMLKGEKVELRGCPETMKILRGIKAATEDDWYEEYLDLILSIKVVDGVEEAIKHINKYGSMHSDAIVTENQASALKFLNMVDSAAVYLNASTRFTDGGQFGMGAEIGISTDKIHARGPMGLEELNTYKYVIKGDGQIRD